MAEVLVGLRKIIQHGLRKQAGDRWPTEACPRQVYERLVQRKENELAIERLSFEYEDLMSFATFADLAEMVRANEGLAKLLRNLAPSADVLCARLIDLETLREKLSRAIPLNPDELSVLSSYSVHLRKTLAGARRKAQRRRSGAAPSRGDQVADGGDEADETHEIGEPEETAGIREAQETEGAVDVREADQEPAVPPVAAATEAGEGDLEEAEEAPWEAVADEGRRTGEPAEEAPTFDGWAVTEEEAGVPQPEASPAAPVTAESHAAAAVSGLAIDPDALAEDVQKAMVDDDDREVLRLLRREVIAAAESMYRAEDEIFVRGWAEVRRDGWFERRNEDLALAPLAEFHDIVDQYVTRSRSGGMTPELGRELLAERRFPQLLLALREVFLRNGV